MTVPPLLRTPSAGLLLVAYPALAGILPAAGRPWLTVPLCLAALTATGALGVRALPGLPAETGVPAARPGLAAATGLITVPLLALLLHATGHPVRPVPLVIACATLVTVLGAVALLRDHRARRRTAIPPGLPAQRRHDTSPPASTGRPPTSPRHSADLPAGPTPPQTPPGYDRTAAPETREPGTPSPPGYDRTAAPETREPGTPPLSGFDRTAPPETPDHRTPSSLAEAPGRPDDQRTFHPDVSAGAPDPDLHGPGRGAARTTAAVAIPLVLAVGVGGPAVHRYLTAPHPAEPGYLSVALNGWAAAIDSPVTVPYRGLVVPVRVTSAGLADITSLLQLRVGGRVLASRPMTVAADSVRSLTVYVPALPPDGRLRTVAISVGATSIGFYARGMADSRRSPQTSSSAAVTGPGVRPHTPGAGPNAPGNRTGTTGSAADRTGGASAIPGSATGLSAAPAGGGVAGTRAVPGPAAGVRARPAAPAGDRTAAPAGDRASGAGPAAGVRTRPVAPAGVRAAGVRAVPGTTAGVHVHSAAPGVRPHSGTAVPGDGAAAGLVPPATVPGWDDGGVATGGGVAGPATAAEDRVRAGGTKGGRAVGVPPWSPAIVSGDDGGGAVPAPFTPGHREPGRVTCSGKRRAVLAGERTAC
jgi:hypothetical protein